MAIFKELNAGRLVDGAVPSSSLFLIVSFSHACPSPCDAAVPSLEELVSSLWYFDTGLGVGFALAGRMPSKCCVSTGFPCTYVVCLGLLPLGTHAPVGDWLRRQNKPVLFQAAVAKIP